MSKFRKIIYALLLSIFAMQTIASVWLHFSYSSNLPKMPEEKSGRIYRMVVNHGFVVYGSEREFYIFQIVQNSQPIAVMCFLIFLMVGLRSGDVKIATGRKLNK